MNKQAKRPQALRAKGSFLCPRLFFFLAVILSVYTTYYVTGHIIDSDASSELVLAKHWIETGQILSSDWIYGSEIRILHMQLVYAPLLMLLDDWQLVRFLGALILQAIYILSYGFLIREAGLSKRIFYIGGAMLLLPVSVSYGRIVLYHCHYLPNISISFLLLGLVLGFEKEINWKKPGVWLRLLGLICLSFLGGVNSVRQLMITHAPMLVLMVVLCLLEDAGEGNVTQPALLRKRNLRLLLAALLAAGMSFLGMKLNTGVLSRYYTSWRTPTNYSLGFVDPVYLNDIVYGFFHQFGFRTKVSMLSLAGILSLGGLAACVYCLWVSVSKLLRHKSGDGWGRIIVQVFFLLHTGVMLVIFLITDDAYYYALYLSLCYPWGAIALAIHWDDIPGEIHPFHSKKLLAWGCMALLVLNGLGNVTYFCGSKLVDQPYEGLLFQNINKKEELTGAVTYLTENGYEIGYATYWEANIITEMTDGAISMVNLEIEDDPALGNCGNIRYYNCLTSLYLREIPAEQKCLLLSRDVKDIFEGSDSFRYCRLVYEDDYHCIYDITDMEAFIPLLYA